MKEKGRFSWDMFHAFPVIGIMRGFEHDAGVEIVEKSMEAGLLNVEVTMNTFSVLEQIQTLSSLLGDRMNIGVGTVLSIEAAETAIAAGATYLVTPVVNPDLIRYCVSRDIPVFPGAYTPTEVYTAYEAGAKIVKLFPVGNGGPKYLSSVNAPLDQVQLLAVDGVTLETFEDYLNAGAFGAGVGGQFFDPQKMKAKDWKWLTVRIQGYRNIFEAWKTHAQISTGNQP